jgi:adenosylcobinamide amidohydrolase
MSSDSTAVIPATLEYRGQLLLVRFREPQSCISWAVVNGGRVTSSCVAWYYVDNADSHLTVEPVSFLTRKLEAAEISGAIGLMTSRKRYGMVEAQASQYGVSAWCMATVGLRNALRVGDETYELPEAGTINLLCWVSCALTPTAELEALTIAAEARTAAVLDAGIPSSVSELPATGTGTDCIILAHPGTGDTAAYAGKHTAVGSAIGKAVSDAIQAGVRGWQSEFGSE